MSVTLNNDPFQQGKTWLCDNAPLIRTSIRYLQLKENLNEGQQIKVNQAERKAAWGDRRGTRTPEIRAKLDAKTRCKDVSV